MKLVKSSFEILTQEPGIIGAKRFCERAGRLCYKSENLITDDSYKKLLNSFEEKGHFSPFAHATVYLIMPQKDHGDLISRLNGTYWDKTSDTTYWDRFHNEVWTRIVFNAGFWYITTNYRVIKELKIEDILEKYWSEPQCFHERRYSVKLNISRAIADELMRHAVALVPVCVSTRYCNYSRDKFDNEVPFAEPSWYNEMTSEQKHEYDKALEQSEYSYLKLLKLGLTPEKARDVLTLDVATEIILTGFSNSWEHVFDLRTTKAAHPDAVAIMKPLAAEMYQKGFITKKYE